jgi:hypothetical protein
MSNKLDMDSGGDEDRENLERVEDSLYFGRGMDEDSENFEELKE